MVLSSEYSREFYLNSLKFFNLFLFFTYIPILFNPFSYNLLYYFSDFITLFVNFNRLELYRNPYRPLKKGLMNMLRLHATGAIALPIELRLQVLASSRDVIHSWALPSAGIKIDCVPGYTSHKVMMFLMEGIYWGQCMEICGRYHHWMPIILYFMRRDLFFLWCSHFIFNSNLTYLWDINDRDYGDEIRYISYDKTAWLNEINF